MDSGDAASEQGGCRWAKNLTGRRSDCHLDRNAEHDVQDGDQKKAAADSEDSGQASNYEPAADNQQQFVWKQHPEHSNRPWK